MTRKMGRERIVFPAETYLDYSDQDHGQRRKGKKRKKQKGRGRAWEEKSTVQLRELEG